MDVMEKNQLLQCCPACGSSNAATIDSRYLDDVGWRRRRRECHACRHRWSTVEVPAELLGQMKYVFFKLKVIEQLAAEGRLSLLDGRLALAWDEAAPPEAPRDAPARTIC